MVIKAFPILMFDLLHTPISPSQIYMYIIYWAFSTLWSMYLIYIYIYINIYILYILHGFTKYFIAVVFYVYIKHNFGLINSFISFLRRIIMFTSSFSRKYYYKMFSLLSPTYCTLCDKCRRNLAINSSLQTANWQAGSPIGWSDTSSFGSLYCKPGGRVS